MASRYRENADSPSLFLTSDEEDSVIKSAPRNSGRSTDSSSSVVISETEPETDEEMKFERRMVSPRTRKSIGGYRRRSTTESESSSDESDVVVIKTRKKKIIVSDAESDSSEIREPSKQVDKSRSSVKSSSARSVLISEEESSNESEGEIVKCSPDSSKPTARFSRYSTASSSLSDFQNASSALHSTGNEEHLKQSSIDEKSPTDPPPHRSPVHEVITTKNRQSEPLKTSGHNDSFQIDSVNFTMPQLSSTMMESKRKQSVDQIHIIDDSTDSLHSIMLHSESNTPLQSIDSFQNRDLPSQRDIYVSQDFYNKEIGKLDELTVELATNKSLIETLGPKLPDKGAKIVERIRRLSNEIEKKKATLAKLVVGPDHGKSPLGNNSKSSPPLAPVNSKSNKSGNSIIEVSWGDIAAAVGEVQPKFTGKVGIAKFNTEKALTVQKLQDIYTGLSNRPGEDVLEDDPPGLKIPLMDHQKHALAWMKWRERQKPRGGILADDMGLGKTLTMISLVLDGMGNAENEESSDSDADHGGFLSKGRKDYYNGKTLIVCPASLLGQWETEVKQRTKSGTLSILVHHGPSRETRPRRIGKYDMVVTTYQLASRECEKNGALFGVKWNRIILDEGHVIRNHKSKTSVAVCELKGKNRWVLTGTPIQNKEMDLYALLKFLKCSPFDDLLHWKRWIDNKEGGRTRLNTLMKSLMLRRTKLQLQEAKTLNCLPQKQFEIIDVHLEKDERNVYQKILLFSQTLFAQFLHQRMEKDDGFYARPTNRNQNDAYYKMHKRFVQSMGNQEVRTHQILTLLLRLRQVCCHPGLIDAMLGDEEMADDVDSSHEDVDLLEQMNKLKIHDNSLNGNGGDECDALSKAASSNILVRSNPVFDIKRQSSKIKAVIELFDKKIRYSNDKAIIVSQWTSVLDIVKTQLVEKGIGFLELNGRTVISQRQAIVNDFNTPNMGKKILLLSLTAGGVGLNLIGANHLLFTDLHWNPQLEAQAQDRIYRVGQKKTVFVYKFMTKDTVEERIRALQDQKLEIANTVLTGAKSTGSKLTIDDLKSLFNM